MAAAGKGPEVLYVALSALESIGRGRGKAAEMARQALAECGAIAQGEPAEPAEVTADEMLARAAAELARDPGAGKAMSRLLARVEA